METIEQIDGHLFRIRKLLKDYSDNKCMLSPDEIQNLLRGCSELLIQKKKLLNQPIYTESKFNILFEQIMRQYKK